MKVHNPLFSVGNVFIGQYNQNDRNSFERSALSGPPKHITKESDGFHYHSTQLTMIKCNTYLVLIKFVSGHLCTQENVHPILS